MAEEAGSSWKSVVKLLVQAKQFEPMLVLQMMLLTTAQAQHKLIDLSAKQFLTPHIESQDTLLKQATTCLEAERKHGKKVKPVNDQQ